MKALTIISYQWKDLFRDKWLIGYALIYLILTDALIRFGGGGPKALMSLSNIMLLFVPLVSLIYGVIYLYQSREFVELLLAQPLERKSLFAGLYGGLAIPLCLAFVVGAGLPLFYSGAWVQAGWDTIFTVFGLGIALSLIFVAIGYLFGLKYFHDRVKGFGYALLSWLFLAVLYDGLILLVVSTFSDYPLEKAIIGLSIINPIDLARIGVLLNFDISALMGYTGAVFSRFFGSYLGLLVSIGLLMLWIALPTWQGLRLFNKKDF
jgi:Cu-processing system permease protein